MAFTLVVTTAGRAAIVNAQNTGTAPVTIAQIGLSQTAVTPAASATTLPGEFKRVSGVAGMVVADDTIHVSVTDSTTDAYSLRSIALYLADGTLFGIYGQAAPILEKTASSLAALAIDVIFADIAAASITFGATNWSNPPATTDVQGVVELATTAEAQAGSDTQRAITPATGKAAVLAWLGFTPLNAAAYTPADVLAKLLTVDGAGSGIDADLLDGQDGAWYANIAARLGYTPVNKAGDTMAGPLALAGAPSANAHAANKSYVDGLVTAAALLSKLMTVDGSGSGLDADLLDGFNSNDFVRVIGASLGGVPGYIKLRIASVDFMMQWQTGTLTSDQAAFFSYAQPFTSWSRAWCSGSQNLQQYQNPPAIVTGSETASGCSVVNGYESTLNFTLFSIGV